MRRSLRRRVDDLEARVDALEGGEKSLEISPWVAGADAYWRTGDIDWAKTRQGGYRFVILKATEGVDYLSGDKKDWFLKASREAKQAGLLVGYYHFGRPGTGPEVKRRHRTSWRRWSLPEEPPPGALSGWT